MRYIRGESRDQLTMMAMCLDELYIGQQHLPNYRSVCE